MDRDRRRSLARIGVFSVLGLLLLAQLVPVERRNPPVESEVDAPPEVVSVLRRACYDCHSNETVWPWYSRVAPVSWLVARDVKVGREELNYSAWERYSAEERAEWRGETWEDVAEGEMPPALYLWMHPDARLSEADRGLLRSWAGGSRPGGELEGDDEDGA